MRFLAKLMLLVMVTVELSACARIQVRKSRMKEPIEQTLQLNFPMVLFGFVALDPPVVLKQRCPNGWSSITTEVKPLQTVFHALTLNLYAPWSAEIECLAPKPPPAEEEDG